MRRRLERAGFRIDAVLGDYDGGPFDERADVWIILAQEALSRCSTARTMARRAWRAKRDDVARRCSRDAAPRARSTALPLRVDPVGRHVFTPDL